VLPQIQKMPLMGEAWPAVPFSGTVQSSYSRVIEILFASAQLFYQRVLKRCALHFGGVQMEMRQATVNRCF
jgi:hypothetical protein